MAIDTSETKNSLFGGIKKTAKQSSAAEHLVFQIEENQEDTVEIKTPTKQEESVHTQVTGAAQPKWQTFDKVTALLTSEQKEGLDRIAKKMMKFRSKALKGESEKERITANTIIRALINNFLQLEESVQMEILTSENDVNEWIKKIFKH